MAQIPFDISLGREVEFYTRVLNNDPTNSAIIGMVLTHAGLEADAVLRTYETFAEILVLNDEVTNAGYSRLVLDQTDLDPIVIDPEFSHAILPLDDQTFPNIVAGSSWSKLVFGYDSDTTGGTDANIIPFAAHDLRDSNGNIGTPNGGDIFISLPNGILRAS